MLVQFGNNWIQKFLLQALEIDVSLQPSPILAVPGVFLLNIISKLDGMYSYYICQLTKEEFRITFTANLRFKLKFQL